MHRLRHEDGRGPGVERPCRAIVGSQRREGQGIGRPTGRRFLRGTCYPTSGLLSRVDSIGDGKIQSRRCRGRGR